MWQVHVFLVLQERHRIPELDTIFQVKPLWQSKGISLDSILSFWHIKPIWTLPAGRIWAAFVVVKLTKAQGKKCDYLFSVNWDAGWHDAGLCQAENFQGLLNILLELAHSWKLFVCSQPTWRMREFISIAQAHWLAWVPRNIPDMPTLLV